MELGRLVAVAILLVATAEGEAGLPAALAKADNAEAAAEQAVAAATPVVWTPTKIEKGLYALADRTLSFAKREPTILEQEIKAYKSVGSVDHYTYRLANAKLEEVSDKYAEAAKRAIFLEMRERRLRTQVMHSRLIRKVLQTKLAAAEARLGADINLRPGQRFGFSEVQKRALESHGVDATAISQAENAVTSASLTYAFTKQQRKQLASQGLDATSIARAERALNAHLAKTSNNDDTTADVPGWNNEEVRELGNSGSSLLETGESWSSPAEAVQAIKSLMADNGAGDKASVSAPKKTPLLPAKKPVDVREDVDMLEAYLSRENGAKATLAQAQTKANTLAKSVLTAEHAVRISQAEVQSHRNEEKKAEAEVSKAELQANEAQNAVMTVRQWIASVEQAKEASEANGHHLAEVGNTLKIASANVKSSETEFLKEQTAYEKALLKYKMTPATLKREGMRSPAQRKVIDARWKEIAKMVDEAQRNLINAHYHPAGRGANALRKANTAMIKLEHDVKADPKDVKVMGNLVGAVYHQKEMRLRLDLEHKKYVDTAKELRMMRDELRNMQVQAELVDEYEDRNLRLDEARILAAKRIKAMNTEEAAVNAHYAVNALKHTQVMVRIAINKADVALKESVSHLQNALVASVNARRQYKLVAGPKARASLAKVKEIHAKVVTERKALTAQLDKRVSERDMAPFVNMDPVKVKVDRESDFVNLPGQEFRALAKSPTN